MADAKGPKVNGERADSGRGRVTPVGLCEIPVGHGMTVRIQWLATGNGKIWNPDPKWRRPDTGEIEDANALWAAARAEIYLAQYHGQLGLGEWTT